MTPHKQLNLHRPQWGLYGDCFRTSLACLLDRPPETVPHFCDNPHASPSDFLDLSQAWLAVIGLTQIQICYPGDYDLQAILGAQRAINPGVHYMLLGTSRTGVHHTVICLSDEIVWDPSQEDSGIVGPTNDGFWWVTFIGKLL